MPLSMLTLMHQTPGRRDLLTAGGTVMAACITGKYLRGDRAAAATQDDAATSVQSVAALHARSPTAALPLHFTTSDGTARTLADYAGRGIVLNFWATWCVPCVSEMPALDSLAQSAAARGIVVLPISLDHSGAPAVTNFYRTRNITNLPILLDPHAASMMDQKLEGIPTTVIIDRKGRETARIEGPVQWDMPDAVDMIAKLVG